MKSSEKKVPIAEIKNYWNKQPCNILHSKKEQGTKEYYNEVEAWGYKIEPHTKLFPQFDRWKGLSVLEIGCGIGTDAVNFCRAGADYTGIELSKESASVTQLRLSTFGLDGKVITGNAEELNLLVGNQKFDLIYSMGVIHHSSNPNAITQQLSNYLTEDGEIRIMLYAKNSWKNILIENNIAQPEAQAACPMAATYLVEEVRELFNDFNVTITQDFIFPWKIPEYKNKILIKEAWFEAMPDEIFSAMEKQLGWHLLITGKLKDCMMPIKGL